MKLLSGASKKARQERALERRQLDVIHYMKALEVMSDKIVERKLKAARIDITNLERKLHGEPVSSFA